MTSRREALLTAAALPLAVLPVRAAAAMPGPPLAGHFTHDSARLWLQATKPARCTLRYWLAAGGEEEAKTVESALAKESFNSAIVEIRGLAPATAYCYRAELEGGSSRAGMLRTASAPVHEFSCSPLTSRIIRLSKGDWANPRLDRECAVETQNYGTLEFSGAGRERVLTARCHDADGRLLWTRVLATAG